jgi:guanine deaminase
MIKTQLLALANNNFLGFPFSACVVYKGRRYYGVNEVTSKNDPTAHAEIQAIRKACAEEKRQTLESAIIYCSGEPCPMCLTAIAWAEIKEIKYINSYEVAIENNYYYDRPSKEVNKFLKLKRTIRRIK